MAVEALIFADSRGIGDWDDTTNFRVSQLRPVDSVTTPSLWNLPSNGPRTSSMPVNGATEKPETAGKSWKQLDIHLTTAEVDPLFQQIGSD